MDLAVRDALSQVEAVTVKFSIDQNHVPFTLIRLDFKTSEVAQTLFELAIRPFWTMYLDWWDNGLNDGKSIELYIIDSCPKSAGRIHGCASNILLRIEKYSKVPTKVSPGVAPMSTFSFGLEEYKNSDMKETLSETSKVTARRWFDKNSVPFTCITLEFRHVEAAQTFFERVVPFWKPNIDRVLNWSLTHRRVELYMIEEDPHNPNLHGKSLQLLTQIERYSRVTTTVFPDECRVMENFEIQVEEGSA